MPKISLKIDDDLNKRIEEYRIQQFQKNGSIPSQTEVIRELLKIALKKELGV